MSARNGNNAGLVGNLQFNFVMHSFQMVVVLKKIIRIKWSGFFRPQYFNNLLPNFARLKAVFFLGVLAAFFFIYPASGATGLRMIEGTFEKRLFRNTRKTVYNKRKYFVINLF